MAEISIQQAVEQRLKKAQEKKEYKDTEKRVFGTRKELAALKMIQMSDLESLEKNPELAVDMVKKDKVFPKLNIEKEIDNGVSGGTAYLKWKLRYYYASAAANNKNNRVLYVGFVTEIINQFWDCVSIDEFKDKIKNWDLFSAIIRVYYPDKVDELKKEFDDQVEAIMKLDQWLNENNNRWIFRNYGEDEKKQKFDEFGIKFWKNSQLQASFREMFPESWMYFDYMNYSQGQERLMKMLLTNSVGDKFFEIFIRQRGIERLYREARDYEPITQQQVDSYNEGLQPSKDELTRLMVAAVVFKETVDSGDWDAVKKLLQDDEFLVSSNLSYVGFHNDKDGKNYYITDLAKYGYPKPLLEWFVGLAQNRMKYRSERLTQYLADSVAAAPVVRGSSYAFAQKTKTKSEQTEGESEKEPEPEINSGIPLAYLKRTGGYSIIEDDIQVNTIIEKFGFASVTFGNYVKDKEAKEHLRHFLGAISDLGDILNMDVITLNRLNNVTKLGGLSMWFGAGGRGGRASAYFRSAGCVINLTKSRGEGTVSHEYAHYLDNALAITLFQSGYYDPTDDRRMFASVTRVPYKGNRKYYDPNSSDRDKYNDPKITLTEVQDAMREIMSFIYDNTLSSSFKEQNPELVQSYTGLGKNQIKTTVEAYNGGSFGIRKPDAKETIEQYLEWFYGRYYQFRDSRNNTPRNLKILGFIVKLFGLKSYDFVQTAYGSKYYLASSKMKSDYWTRPWELFARAFETYIYDKLAEKGRVNNYLVSGGMFKYLVYPQDQERKILFVLYDNLMQAIKRNLQIPDFKPIRNERVDEYIDFDENAEVEAVESGIVVDDKTKKVIKEVSDTASIQTKLEALLNLLQEEKQ